MATRYDLDTSAENPIITLRRLDCFKNNLDTIFGGDMTKFGDLLVILQEKVKYYIAKDETGYKIVDSEAEN